MTIRSSTHHLGEVRRFVEEHAHGAQLPDEQVEQLRMAVDEACSNVIEHAYKGDEDCTIEVAVIVAPDRFTVRIRDEGRPFRPQAYTPPDVKQFVQQRRSGGLGVHLMRQLMDRVEYNTQGAVNEVRLVKYRNGLGR